LYKHYYLGENRRTYQLWLKINDLCTIEKFIDTKYNPEFQKLVKEKLIDKGIYMTDLADMVNHIDEVVSEVYPKLERQSHPQKTN